MTTAVTLTCCTCKDGSKHEKGDMEIIFCRTRADPEYYRSYTDFWRLVELAGFGRVWLDELEPGRDAVYILTPMNAEYADILPRLRGGRRCKVAWWRLERPGAYNWVGKAHNAEGVDQVWVSDRHWAGRVECPGRFVALGSHEGLGGFAAAKQKCYEWTHMSAVNGRRAGVYARIGGRQGMPCWPPERDAILQATAFMVNVHKDDYGMFEPLRFAVAAAYGMPIISEVCDDPFPYEPVMVAYKAVAEAANISIDTYGHNPERWFGRAVRNWQSACKDNEFEKSVKEAVYALAG